MPTPTEETTAVRSYDGLTLAATITRPSQSVTAAAVLVHGGGATRHEAGYFTRLAAGLASASIAVLRFDLRGHGESGGRQEDLTLAATANDIGAAAARVRELSGVTGPVHLYATSFSGGVTAWWTTKTPDAVASLTLANPLLDYRKRFVDDKPYWHHGVIDDDHARQLAEQGFVSHSPAFKLGRPLLNEVFYLDARAVLPALTTPTLIVHGTEDTFVPVDSSRSAIRAIPGESRLLEIPGAQHGFAVDDDPAYADPQSQAWQASVIEDVTGWMTSHS